MYRCVRNMMDNCYSLRQIKKSELRDSHKPSLHFLKGISFKNDSKKEKEHAFVDDICPGTVSDFCGALRVTAGWRADK